MAVQRVMDKLFNAVRAACSAATWSKGVELVRAGQVVADEHSGAEVQLRVTSQGGLVAPRVTLFLKEQEWTCECPSGEEACMHVAAAVIALRQQQRTVTSSTPPAAAGDGNSAPPPQPQPGPTAIRTEVGQVAYRFQRSPQGLRLQRVIAAGGQEETALTTTLTALASGRVPGPRFVASPSDIACERLLGAPWQGLLSRQVLAKVLELLIDHPNVQLDGKIIGVAAAAPALRATLVNRPEGYLLTVEQDPSIDEVFANGAVRTGALLRPLADITLRHSDVAQLRRGRFFSFREVEALVTQVLPELQEQLPVQVHATGLPTLRRGLKPRLLFDVSDAAGTLLVLVLLVYGEPSLARVDGDTLTALGPTGLLPSRDRDAEERLKRRLQQSLGLQIGVKYSFSGHEALHMAALIEQFATDGAPHEPAPGGRLLKAGAGRAGSPASHAVVGAATLERFFLAPPLAPQVQKAGDTVEFYFATTAANAARTEGRGTKTTPSARVSANAVLEAWQRNEPLVALQGGGFAPLPTDWLRRFGPQLASLLALKQAQGESAPQPHTIRSAHPLPPHALLNLAHLCDALNAPRPAVCAPVTALLETQTSLEEAALPADLRASLRPYQRQGVAWLAFLRQLGLGALLADDMGLGKTLQTLSVLMPGERALVVAPTSVLHNWLAETARFRPALRAALYHGPKRALDAAADVVITSYAVLRLDGALLAEHAWDVVVLDEAQSIKNPASQVAGAAFALCARWRLALSGTPVENRLEELWSLCHFTNPGLLGSRQDFDAHYSKPIAAGAPDVAAALRARLRPLMLRRLKRDVEPQLPPRTDVILRCELSPEERRVYQAMEAATRAEVVEQLAAGASVLAALEALLRLRQACCHSALVPGQQANTSAKMAVLLENLSEAVAEEHKAIIFSQWTALLDLVEPELRAASINFVRLDGSTRDRGAVVAQFQDPHGPPVILISLKAGGTGLNLTAADNVFILDPWWNPAAEEQAVGRAHRIGQTRPVLVQRLIAADTVEERILALQEHKNAMAAAAMEEAQQAAALSRADLLQLLAP